jgi:glycerophosphoryl diester phosphodiesterase
VQQQLPSRLDPPIIFAHRGASAHAPENTLEAFELALRLGATGLETDVWLTADGVPVLDHDGTVRVRRRKRPIADVQRTALPEHIPSLQQLLDVCGTDVELSIDVKDPAAAEPTIATVADVDPDMLRRTWLCDPDLDRLLALRARAPTVRLVHSTRFGVIRRNLEHHAAALADGGVDALNMHRTDWNGGLAVLLHRFERLAFGWDLQYDHELVAGLRMGLDAVYGDDVSVMVDALATVVGEGPLT